MAKIKMNLITPKVPNFISIESPPGARQDGFKEFPTISIADLDDEVLEEIAEEWRLDLLARANKIRSNNAQIKANEKASENVLLDSLKKGW